MDAERFDQIAKAWIAVGSRRRVIGGLLGGVLGLRRIGAARANHKPGHRCTPSVNHDCESCLLLEATCVVLNDECCEGLQCCARTGTCQSILDNCDGLD
jgi:hypothetical protein